MKNIIKEAQKVNTIESMNIIGQTPKKIIVQGLLLPKDKVSRNGVLYDWESINKYYGKLTGLPMLYNHLNESDEKPIGKFTKSWLKEKDDDEGIAGWYYEADINPTSKYADSILRGDLSKVSIQVIANDQKTEESANGEGSFVRAFINDVVEASVVPTPGFMDTNINVIYAESFKINKENNFNEGIFDFYKFSGKIKYPNKISDETLLKWVGRKKFEEMPRNEILNDFINEIENKKNKNALNHLFDYSKNAIDDNMQKYNGIKESIDQKNTKFDKLSTYLYSKPYSELGPVQQTKIVKLISKEPSLEMVEEFDEKKKMEDMTTSSNPGASQVMMKKKEYVMTDEFKKYLSSKGMGKWNGESELEAEYGNFVRLSRGDESFNKESVDFGRYYIMLKNSNDYNKARELLKGLYRKTSWDFDSFDFENPNKLDSALKILKDNNILLNTVNKKESLNSDRWNSLAKSMFPGTDINQFNDKMRAAVDREFDIQYKGQEESLKEDWDELYKTIEDMASQGKSFDEIMTVMYTKYGEYFDDSTEIRSRIRKALSKKEEFKEATHICDCGSKMHLDHNKDGDYIWKCDKCDNQYSTEESFKEASVNTRYAVYDSNDKIIKIFEDRDDAWKFIDNHKNDNYEWAVYPESFHKEAKPSQDFINQQADRLHKLRQTYLDAKDVDKDKLKKDIDELSQQLDKWSKESYSEAINVGDKVHSPSGYAKVVSIKDNKVVVRSNDPAGEFEYDLSQVHKETIHNERFYCTYCRKLITDEDEIDHWNKLHAIKGGELKKEAIERDIRMFVLGHMKGYGSFRNSQEMEDAVKKKFGWNDDIEETAWEAWNESENRENLKKEASASVVNPTGPNDVDQNELEMGLNVEMEHTDDKKLALKIALDHLAEIPDYYTRLKKMEDEAKNVKEMLNLVEILSESECREILKEFNPEEYDAQQHYIFLSKKMFNKEPIYLTPEQKEQVEKEFEKEYPQ